MVSGGWLVHAAGRLDQRGALMAFTVLHQLGASAWAGGLICLGALWRAGRRDAELAALWPTLVGRFSWLALAAVAVTVIRRIRARRTVEPSP